MGKGETMSSKFLTATGDVVATGSKKNRGVLKKIIITSAAAAGTCVVSDANNANLLTIKCIDTDSFSTGRISIPWEGYLKVTLTTANAYVEYA
jgi:hypothetical protein